MSSAGIVTMGNCVSVPAPPLMHPARSNNVARSEYMYPGNPLRLGISPFDDDTSRSASA